MYSSTAAKQNGFQSAKNKRRGKIINHEMRFSFNLRHSTDDRVM